MPFRNDLTVNGFRLLLYPKMSLRVNLNGHSPRLFYDRLLLAACRYSGQQYDTVPSCLITQKFHTAGNSACRAETCGRSQKGLTFL